MCGLKDRVTLERMGDYRMVFCSKAAFSTGKSTPVDSICPGKFGTIDLRGAHQSNRETAFRAVFAGEFTRLKMGALRLTVQFIF
jgi:hypothetical protein